LDKAAEAIMRRHYTRQAEFLAYRARFSLGWTNIFCFCVKP
jgi:hypothetical protein